MQRRIAHARATPVVLMLAFALALTLMWATVTGVAAQTKDKPAPPQPATASQPLVIEGYPIRLSVQDNMQLDVQFTNPALGQNLTHQFYGDYGEGVYLWVNAHSVTKVFGPEFTPGGHYTNPYAPVSNTVSGTGTPQDPWVVTTVNDVPGTKLRLTQTATYVNGAEYVKMQYAIEQLGGSEPVKVSLFHAADLVTGGATELAYGYHDVQTGGVGDYFTFENGANSRVMYQQFVPWVTESAHQEGNYGDIWDAIGDISAIGPGLNNICLLEEEVDAGFGLQWDMTVQSSGAIVVGDTIFLGPHTNLAGSFSDVPYGYYAYEQVYALGTNHVVNGYDDGTFRPNAATTRGQVAKMIVLATGWPINTTDGPHFTDVPVGSTFYDYIETAYQHGIIRGYSDGTYRPGENVTRGQLMKIVAGAAGWKIDTTGGPHFTDVPVGSTFYDYIETAYNNGFIKGYDDGTFHPGNNATRGQISKILYPLLVAMPDR
jgi:hypothetical protein